MARRGGIYKKLLFDWYFKTASLRSSASSLTHQSGYNYYYYSSCSFSRVPSPTEKGFVRFRPWYEPTRHAGLILVLLFSYSSLRVAVVGVAGAAVTACGSCTWTEGRRAVSPYPEHDIAGDQGEEYAGRYESKYQLESD